MFVVAGFLLLYVLMGSAFSSVLWANSYKEPSRKEMLLTIRDGFIGTAVGFAFVGLCAVAILLIAKGAS